MSDSDFEALLRGERQAAPPHDFHWALVRLIEYAPYREIRRLLPRERFLEEWPVVASRVRSRARREGMEFLHQWLGQNPVRHG